MKLLIKKILSNEVITTLRNSLNIKPIQINKYYTNQKLSISDAFLFRTDNNFSTSLRFSDLPKIFYKIENSSVEIIFCDYQNNFLKKINLNNLNKVNELIIDKKFLNNIETFGHFYLFHKIHATKNDTFHLSNRCYLGFSRHGTNPSFVHGNSFVKGRNYSNGNIISNFVKTSYIRNYEYSIQESFLEFDKVELFINNPTNKLITLEVNECKYILKPDNDIRISLSKLEKINIKSNCALLRPIVFTFKGSFYDVHHA
tara:strand:- start:646 stop:1416 length:771 start_codon:yes stop_codon:yes gene_type:complete